MPRPALPLLLAAALAACSASRADGGPATAAVPDSVVVTPTSARLVVALASDATQWQWYAPSTPANVLEYEWNVIVPGGTGGTHHAGFHLFKFPGAAPASGDLNALVRAGQVDIARDLTEGGRRIVRPTGLALGIRPEPGRLVFLVPDSAVAAQLFAGRPREVTVTRRLAGRDLPRRTVRVTYVDR